MSCHRLVHNPLLHSLIEFTCRMTTAAGRKPFRRSSFHPPPHPLANLMPGFSAASPACHLSCNGRRKGAGGRALFIYKNPSVRAADGERISSSVQYGGGFPFLDRPVCVFHVGKSAEERKRRWILPSLGEEASSSVRTGVREGKGDE